MCQKATGCERMIASKTKCSFNQTTLTYCKMTKFEI